VTAAGLSPHALVINSFSKYFFMTGWRVAGWVPAPLVRPIERLQQIFRFGADLSQVAAEAAFEGRDEMKSEAGLRRKRAF